MIISLGTVRHLRAHPAATLGRPLVVVTDIANLRRDTASEWLQEGLAQMIAADLGRDPDIEVIASARVRDTRIRAEKAPSGALAQDDAMDIARRLGAAIAVRGGFSQGDGSYVLDLDIRDVATGKSLRSFTLSGTGPMEVADEAAGSILAWTAARDARPRFAEIETSTTAAYQHFVRAMQADAEGRPEDAVRELDAAIALDSGFASALIAREQHAHYDDDDATVARLRHALVRARLTDGMHSYRQSTQRITTASWFVPISSPWSCCSAIRTTHGHTRRSRASTRTAAIGLITSARRSGSLRWTRSRTKQDMDRACHARLTRRSSTPARGAAIFAAQRRQLDAGLRCSPISPGPGRILAEVLGYAGRYDAAIAAERRAALLSGDDPMYALASLARSF